MDSLKDDTYERRFVDELYQRAARSLKLVGTLADVVLVHCDDDTAFTMRDLVGDEVMAQHGRVKISVEWESDECIKNNPETK